jgi:hypothetical protein
MASGEAVSAAKVQEQPAAARRSFFTLACMITRLLPEARVTGAEPA